MRQAWSAAQAAVRAQGEETPSEPESLGGGNEEDEDEEDGEVSPLPHSPPPNDLPSLGDLFGQQAGINAAACQLKRPQIGTEASFDPPPQSDLMLVLSDLQQMSVALVVTGIAHLLRVLLVPSSPLASRAVAAMMVGPSSLGTGGAEPSSKKACPWSFLPVSSRYAYGIAGWFTLIPLLLFLF
jgi:hypothetical protein